MASSEVIVIGGGVNGLAAAAFLARGGRAVTLLEAGAETGGAALTAPLCDGFRVPRVAHLLTQMHPAVVTSLDLGRHGLDTRAPAAATALLSEAGPVVLSGAWGEQVAGVSPGEALAWAELRARLLRYARALAPFLDRPAPEFGALGLGDGFAAARAALGLRRHGKATLRDFLRTVLMPAAECAEEALGDPRLQGLVAFDATLGGFLGPRAPASLLGLIHRLTGTWGGVQGAMPALAPGALADALGSAARAADATIRTGARAVRILIEGGQAAGVALASGEELRASSVLSALAPQVTLLGLLGARHLGTLMVRDLRAIRARGAAAKLNLALEGVPDFGARAGRYVLAPSADHVERASNGVKYSESPEAPVMEAVLHGAPFAPEGASVLSVILQFVPADPPGREALTARTIAALDRFAPGFAGMVRHAEFLSPADIGRLTGLPGGQWHAGEMAPDQLVALRPAHGLARYRTPLPGLWLTGAGTHPGGGVSGLAGLNAARAMLEARP